MFVKSIIFKENRLVFFFSLAVIFGSAISILFGNDLSQFPDSITYTGLANFDFDQSVVRRYRILIPFAAGFIDWVAGGLFRKLSPSYFVGDFSLSFSFFLVNSLLMAWFGQLIYRYCRSYQLNRMASIVALVFMLSSRYTIYFAALPLIDSLCCVVIALTLLGIKEKNTNMLLFCIFVGPFSRESFIFIAPIIFLFSHLSKSKLFLYFCLSGLIIFPYHFLYDNLYPPLEIEWLAADMNHLSSVKGSLQLLFSLYGIYKILINIGFWIGLPIIGLIYTSEFRTQFFKLLNPCNISFLIAILIQMLLSGSFERMFYLAMPFLALIMAFSFESVVRQIHSNRINFEKKF